jgi:hypothetical protein
MQNPRLNEEISRILTDPNVQFSNEPGQVLPMFGGQGGRSLPVSPAAALGITPNIPQDQDQPNQ